MPLNFPEIWLGRVRRLITSLDSAPWLGGIEELPHAVVEMGSGSDGETNVVSIPLTEFEPDVLINNSAYPIALQNYTDSQKLVTLDKYQTLVTTLSDDEIMGASYDKIDSTTRGHVQAILKSKYQKAIFSLAPQADAADTPVLEATGEQVATEGNRRRLTYNDLVQLKKRFDKLQADPLARRIVLSDDHYNDLLLSGADEVRKQLHNYQDGQVAPRLAGFEVFQYTGNPYFDNLGAKKAFGEVPVATDRRASVAYLTNEVVKKTGRTKQYFTPASENPRTQANELNYRHYFIATPLRTKFYGAIY